MKKTFRNGYESFINLPFLDLAKNTTAFSKEYVNYCENVESEIRNLENDLNNYKRCKTPIKQLKGNIAEVLHAGTFNINAALNKSNSRVKVLKSNEFASPDIIGVKGKIKNQKFSLKYYSSPKLTAKQQAISYREKYNQYLSKNPHISYEKFLLDRNINHSNIDCDSSIYNGQIRVVPKEQFKGMLDYLNKTKIKEMSLNRNQAHRYEETFNNTRSCIDDGNGVQSTAFTTESVEQITKEAKEGVFNAKNHGYEAPKAFDMNKMIKKSLHDGLKAATLSSVISIAPKVYNLIAKQLNDENVTIDDVKSLGVDSFESFFDASVKGVITGAIVYYLQTNEKSLVNINNYDTIVASLVILTYNVFKNTILVMSGKMTTFELVDDFLRNTTTLTSMILGQLIIFPFIPLLGSIIGSLIGSFLHDRVKNKVLSLCVTNGVTLFGLVKQDYNLPKDIIEKLNIDTFDYESFDYETFGLETINFETFEYDTFLPENIEIKFLRRGFVSINRVDYINK